MPEEKMEPKDRRSQSRRPITTQAKILSPKGKAIPCTLHNISNGGAMIAIEQGADLPPHFLFEIPGNVSIYRRCRLAWREGGYVGMEFRCRNKKPRGSMAAV
jgi:hypothetical protein